MFPVISNLSSSHCGRNVLPHVSNYGNGSSTTYFETWIRVPSTTFFLAPNTVIERDAPVYQDGDQATKEPSYIEKILAMTEDIRVDDELSKSTSKDEEIDNKTITHALVKDNNNIQEQSHEIEAVNDIYATDHSILTQSQFPWKQKKDYGTYEVLRIHIIQEVPSQFISLLTIQGSSVERWGQSCACITILAIYYREYEQCPLYVACFPLTHVKSWILRYIIFWSRSCKSTLLFANCFRSFLNVYKRELLYLFYLLYCGI